VACDDNGGDDGSSSRVRFNVQEGTIYFLAVDGVGGEWGTVVLNYDLMQPPTLVIQSADQIVTAGSTVQLSMTVTGRPEPQLQWRLNGADIDFENSSTIAIEAFSTVNEGAYQLQAVNEAGEVVSEPVSVLIGAPLKLQSLNLNEAKVAKFRLVGLHSKTYLIQASTNLTDWSTIATNYSDTGILSYLDSSSTNHSRRFYRAVPLD
jgi:hypothetical protein